MPEQSNLDLTRPTEATRRAVYDRVVSLIWTSTGPDDHVPGFTPDQAGLVIFYVYGRWFAVWADLEADGLGSVDRKTELVRVQDAPESPFGIILAEI